MCQLLETIQLLDGKPVNVDYHNRRFNAARKLLFGCTDLQDLTSLIEIPAEILQGLYRCRILYGKSVHSVEFIPYQYRKIESLKLITAGSFDYRLKYADRRHLESLFALRGTCDDIIVVQQGCITDSYAANLVFSDGEEWYTPDTPLLEGTQRARLLDTGAIRVCRITLKNYRDFDRAGLINAFCDLGNMPVITMDKIS
jgi:4-amino-4-deoxychorismate lyase